MALHVSPVSRNINPQMMLFGLEFEDLRLSSRVPKPEQKLGSMES